MDLGVASKPVNTEKGIEEVEVEMAEEQEMIDKYYDAALQNLQIKQDIVTQVSRKRCSGSSEKDFNDGAHYRADRLI